MEEFDIILVYSNNFVSKIIKFYSKYIKNYLHSDYYSHCGIVVNKKYLSKYVDNDNYYVLECTLNKHKNSKVIKKRDGVILTPIKDFINNKKYCILRLKSNYKNNIKDKDVFDFFIDTINNPYDKCICSNVLFNFNCNIRAHSCSSLVIKLLQKLNIIDSSIQPKKSIPMSFICDKKLAKYFYKVIN